jgi:hypothetical protein
MMVWRLALPLSRRALVAQLVEQCATAGLSAPQVRYRLGPWTWPLRWPGARLLVDLIGRLEGVYWSLASHQEPTE